MVVSETSLTEGVRHMSGKRLSAAERKKQILKCAVRVFARSNYYNTRMVDIAKEAGISEAMVYKHFSSKKEIFLALLRHMSETIITSWEKESVSTMAAPEKIRAGLSDYYCRMIKHPDELKVHFLAVSGIDDRDIFTRLRDDHQSYVGFITRIVQDGIDQGEIRRDVDAGALGFAFNGLGIMMNMMQLLGFDREFDEKTLESILDHFVESIRA